MLPIVILRSSIHVVLIKKWMFYHYDLTLCQNHWHSIVESLRTYCNFDNPVSLLLMKMYKNATVYSRPFFKSIEYCTNPEGATVWKKSSRTCVPAKNISIWCGITGWDVGARVAKRILTDKTRFQIETTPFYIASLCSSKVYYSPGPWYGTLSSRLQNNIGSSFVDKLSNCFKNCLKLRD